MCLFHTMKMKMKAKYQSMLHALFCGRIHYPEGAQAL